MGVSSSYMYPDLNTAKRAVKELGQQITRAGLPDRCVISDLILISCAQQLVVRTTSHQMHRLCRV